MAGLDRCAHGLILQQSIASWIAGCPACAADEAERLERRAELLEAHGGELKSSPRPDLRRLIGWR